MYHRQKINVFLVYVCNQLKFLSLHAAGVDYAVINIDLTFPANSPVGTQLCFDIQPFIIDDLLKELLEFFQLSGTLTDPRCIFRGPARVDIEDNESVLVL